MKKKKTVREVFDEVILPSIQEHNEGAGLANLSGIEIKDIQRKLDDE